MANVTGAGQHKTPVDEHPFFMYEDTPPSYIHQTPSPTLPIKAYLDPSDYGRVDFSTSHPFYGVFSPHHLSALPDHAGGDLLFSFPSSPPNENLTQKQVLLPIQPLTQKCNNIINFLSESTASTTIYCMLEIYNHNMYFVSGLKTPTGVTKKVLCQVYKEKKRESIQRIKEKKYVMNSKLSNSFFLRYTNTKQKGGSVWT